MYDQAKLKATNFKGQRGFLKKFYVALSGISYAWRNERGMRSHSLLMVTTLSIAFLFDINANEILLLTFAFLLVLIAEMFNTAIELTVDLFTVEPAINAKIAKDVAAGAVLVALLGSIIISIVIICPHLAAILL